MTPTKEQIEAVLRDATARPWYEDVRTGVAVISNAPTPNCLDGEVSGEILRVGGKEEKQGFAYKLITDRQKADMQLVSLAVNSYEAHREALKRCYEWLCTEEAQKSPYHRETKRQVEAALNGTR